MMVSGGSVLKYSSDSVVIKSANDRRLYRVIQLSNGLVALLVHDPQIYPDGLPQPSHLPDKTEPEVEDEDECEDEVGDGDEDEDDEEEDEEEEEDEDEDEADADNEKEKTAQTKKAAAAMCVGFGSFSDPPEAQGLAHFLEHMLFMGSTEFPDENEVCSSIIFPIAILDA